MPIDHIRYDILAQDALRGVVRKVLADAAKKGLPGEHHFFITFDTKAGGVRLSARMREQYPDEMTIVLQHQFWDLKVADEHFEVGLSFGGVPEKLLVPFEAIKSFVDPSIQFGLQFETIGDEAAEGAVPVQAKGERPAGKPDKPQANKPQTKPQPAAQRDALPTSVPAAPATQRAEAAAKPEPQDTPDKPGGEVVRLDRFRKK